MEQRELDFRAWCIPEGRYYHYVEIYAYKDGSCGWSAGENNNHPVGRSDNFIIEQYTGVKDKNGIKIFEGDKFEGDEPDEYYVVEYNTSEARFQVNMYGYKMFHNEGGGEEFQSYISRVDENCFEVSCLCASEIIGNIHESSEGAKTNL